MEVEYNKLDDDWIVHFEKTDKLYEHFYKDDVYYINIRVIYINRENAIDKIKHESFLINNINKISREEVIQLLKKNSIDNNRSYTLLAILRYNITLEPDEVKHYLKYGDNADKYLSIIKNIDTITFEKTINMFQDLNDLVFIFYEKSSELKKPNDYNGTKKIYIHSLNTKKKTIKKRYKE